jgi:hypothetical protein
VRRRLFSFLLAKATATSIRGLRVSMRCNHDPAGAPFRAAQPTTALAPMISRRRIVRSPLCEVPPSLCLPPVDRCTGVRPSQAAKSRALEKVCAGGAKALIAAAVMGPIPGMVFSRRASPSSYSKVRPKD